MIPDLQNPVVSQNSDTSLFPVWQRCQLYKNLPVFFRRVLFAGPGNRSVHGVLSLVGDQARLSITYEEPGQNPVLIQGKGSEGVGSLARAMQWAEWVISDYEALCEGGVRKLSRKGSRVSSVREVAA